MNLETIMQILFALILSMSVLLLDLNIIPKTTSNALYNIRFFILYVLGPAIISIIINTTLVLIGYESFALNFIEETSFITIVLGLVTGILFRSKRLSKAN